LEASGGKIIVNPDRTAVVAEQGPLKRTCREKPLVQLLPPNAERIVNVLIRTCPISVERDGKSHNANSCHRLLRSDA
jgi:hypothetical protein